MFGLLDFRRRQRQRDLALAIISDVTATLGIIAAHNAICQATASDLQTVCEHLLAIRLPAFPDGPPHVARLALLEPSVQRQIVYFYARITSLTEQLNALPKSAHETSPDEAQVRETLAELTNTEHAAADLLRALRLVVRTTT